MLKSKVKKKAAGAKKKTTKSSGKLDLYKLHASEYVTPNTPMLVKTTPAVYLAIEGAGDPNSELFGAKVGALYNVAFTMKMARKFAGCDYTVCKLEGQWWVVGDKPFMETPKEDWRWKLMIRTPEFITKKEVAGVIEKLIAKGKPAEVKNVKLEKINEGLCVQMLHIGPYMEEAPTIKQMCDYRASIGKSFNGLHHEIYLSDPRKVAPAKLRTILRYPVK